MTTQNLFQAIPCDPAKTGFNFTDLESYRAEYEHFRPAQSEPQIIVGNQIDLELLTSLKIN